MDAILPVAASAVLLYASWTYFGDCAQLPKIRPALFGLTVLAGALAIYSLSVQAGVCHPLVQNPKIMNLLLGVLMVSGGFYVRNEMAPCADWFHENLVWMGGAGILAATIIPWVLDSKSVAKVF